MPKIETPNKNGVLRAGVVNDLGMPFSFIKDGKLIGFDVEMATRFAAYTGREFQPVPLEFGSLIASVSTHKIDIITASMFITEERKMKIDFSDPYFDSGGSLIARNDRIDRAPSALMSSVDDLAGKKIGVFTGTVFDGFVQQKYPTAQILRYESPSDMVLSIETGKVDAALFDLITARLLIKHNPDLGLLSENVLSTPLGIGFSKSNPRLRNDFNDFLRESRSDGTYAAMNARWLTGDAETAVMPTIPPNPAGRRLVAGVSIDDLPYVAYKDGNYEGFDIELLQSFARRKGYNLEIVTMEFSALINALAAGKVEMIADGISITEERKKQIDFSDSYADFRTAVVAAKKNLGAVCGRRDRSGKQALLQTRGRELLQQHHPGTPLPPDPRRAQDHHPHLHLRRPARNHPGGSGLLHAHVEERFPFPRRRALHLAAARHAGAGAVDDRLLHRLRLGQHQPRHRGRPGLRDELCGLRVGNVPHLHPKHRQGAEGSRHRGRVHRGADLRLHHPAPGPAPPAARLQGRIHLAGEDDLHRRIYRRAGPHQGQRHHPQPHVRRLLPADHGRLDLPACSPGCCRWALGAIEISVDPKRRTTKQLPEAKR